MGATEIQELDRRLADLEEEVRLLKEEKAKMKRDLIIANDLIKSVTGFGFLASNDSECECEC